MNRGIFTGLALFSILLYFLEMSMGYAHSLASPWYFIWAERIIAVTLTVEIGLRAWKRQYQQEIWGKPLLIIDLVSVIPFWVGFFVPVSMLGWIRSLRILRALKLLRYLRSLQLVYLSFYRAWKQLKPLLIAWTLVVVFCSAIIYQIERDVQDDFDKPLNCVYFSFITASTIGYGDMSPNTDVGKIATMTTSFVSLLLFAGMVGVVGSSIGDVMKEEEDETVDPLK